MSITHLSIKTLMEQGACSETEETHIRLCNPSVLQCSNITSEVYITSCILIIIVYKESDRLYLSN